MLALAVSTMPVAAWSGEEGTCARGDNAKHFVVRAGERLTAFSNSNLQFALSSPRLGALPKRWRQIEALAFALHEHGTLDGEAIKLILNRTADDRASYLQQGVRLNSYRLPDYCW